MSYEPTPPSATSPVGDEYREVAAAPGDRGPEAGGEKPLKLLVDATWHVVHAVDRGDRVGRIVGDNNVGEHEAPARPQGVRCSPEELRLGRPGKVMHGQRRHDKVKRTARKRNVLRRDFGRRGSPGEAGALLTDWGSPARTAGVLHLSPGAHFAWSTRRTQLGSTWLG